MQVYSLWMGDRTSFFSSFILVLSSFSFSGPFFIFDFIALVTCVAPWQLKCGRTLNTSLEHLQHPHDPDAASVPSTLDDFCQQVASLSNDDLSFLTNTNSLEPIKKEWLQWYNCLNNLSRSGMIQLVHAGVLPKIFLHFWNLAPFCASCVFGKARRHHW